MQRLLTLIFVIFVLLGVCALAQKKSETAPASKDKSSPAAKVSNLRGRVKSEGGKVTFITRGDRRSWDVMNPEALKGHEEQLISIKAQVYPDKNAIRVIEIATATQPNAHVHRTKPPGTE